MNTATEKIQDIARIESDMATLSKQRTAALGTLKNAINTALICWNKQFPECHGPKTDGNIGVMCVEFGHIANIGNDEHLLKVRLDGETLTAYFAGPERFTDEPNGFEVTLPVRYLGVNCKAAIITDAKRLQDAEYSTN